MKFTDAYKGFLNLPHRTDRLTHMTEQLNRAGIDAVRHAGKLPHEVDQHSPKYRKMFYRTPGAIPCHLGQVEIMKTALLQNRDAVVFEDDCVFCSDFARRIAYIENWTEAHEWDVVWLGASFHCSPPWWHRKGHRERELEDCSCELHRDAETTDDPRMMRTYGAFATFAYIVNKDSIEKILTLFDQNIHTSIGIDWLFIKLQPQLKCYSFVPGCVRQMDNQSDIGNGITVWSGFLKLNGTVENSAYVYQQNMDDFNPLAFDWREAANH